MVSIEEIIRQSINPFDEKDFKYGDFWLEKQEQALTVDSIHQQEMQTIETYLDTVAKSHYSRTTLLLGDSGAGKSYLLGRLKKNLNNKAFFVYIDPWADSKFIWRHILRKTVDSLLYKPEGKTESQLLLWLKGLSAFKSGGFTKWLLGERGLFIKNLQNTYPAGIYNSKQFFGVLYDLTNPELYALACDWLRGDDLDEDDLKSLKVRRSLDSEDAAKNMLANFGRIAAETYPIVLCFDHLDNAPRLADNFLDLQALFNVNTTIHNQYYKNFLVIISMPTSTWETNSKKIQPADLAEGRLHDKIRLKFIDGKQVEALWALRLHSLHQQATPKPASNIHPLSVEQLKINFPSGKTLPRNSLLIGRNLFQQYKDGLCKIIPPPPDILAAFRLIWLDEYKKHQLKIQKITLLSVSELIKMLRETLESLGVKNIQSNPSKTDKEIYLLTYNNNNNQKIGVVWSEDQDMRKFVNLMKNCQNAITKKTFHNMYLVRFNSVGNAKLKGYQIYQQIFPTSSSNRHLKPSLTDIHYLATYHGLVNSAKSNELVIAGKPVTFEELKQLIRDSEILRSCPLLQGLKIVTKPEIKLDSNEITTFIMSLVRTQSWIGIPTLKENTLRQFPDLQKAEFTNIIKELCQANKLKITNPDAPLEQQLICFVP
jgi:hypothetical protein